MIGVMRRAVFIAGVALMAAMGCYVWHERPVTTPASTVVSYRLRVTTDRGARRLTLQHATVRPDSVVGLLIDAADRRGGEWVADRRVTTGQRTAVAVAKVWSLEEHRESAGRELALAAAVLAVVALVAFAAVAIPLAQSD